MFSLLAGRVWGEGGSAAEVEQNVDEGKTESLVFWLDKIYIYS